MKTICGKLVCLFVFSFFFTGIERISVESPPYSCTCQREMFPVSFTGRFIFAVTLIFITLSSASKFLVRIIIRISKIYEIRSEVLSLIIVYSILL